MITLIKIVVLVGIIAVLLIIGGVAVLLRWLKKQLRSAAAGPHCPPCRVHPEAEPNPQWRNPDKINGYAAEFKRLGFQTVGAFTIPEMNGLQMFAFVHLQERLYGVIYDHQRIAPTFDICCDFADQTGVSATNTKTGANLDKRPGHPILWLGDDRVEAVFEAVRNHPHSAVRAAISAETFLPDFCRNYAQGMNWRMKKGGVSREEIRRQANDRGRQLDEAGLEEAYKNLRQAHLTELQQGCLAQYLDEQRLAPAEWEQARDRTLAVPETLEAAEVIELIESTISLDEEQRYELGKMTKNSAETALEFVDRMMHENVADLGLKKVGQVQEPVPAYVLEAPSCEAVAKACPA